MPGPDHDFSGALVFEDTVDPNAPVAFPRIGSYAGDPNGVIAARESSLLLDFVTPALWRNTDGATTWEVVGGGGADTFVATNEWFVDSTAAASEDQRIFPNVTDAITDANAKLPANQPIVLRLREGQNHAWDMGTGQDGTRDISIYGHNNTADGQARLTLSGDLDGAGAARWLFIDNVEIAGTFTIAAPWNKQIRRCSFVGKVAMTVDTAADDNQVLIQESDALIANRGGGAGHPLAIDFTGGGVGSNLVKFVDSEIEFYDGANPTGPAVVYGSGQLWYANCRLRANQPANGGEIGAIWSVPVGSAGEVTLEMTQIEFTTFAGVATMFAEVDANTMLVNWRNAWVSALSADVEGIGMDFSFGSRFDGLNAYNQVTYLRGQNLVGGTITLPADAPYGCIAVEPRGTQGRETHWICERYTNQTGEYRVWLGANGRTHWYGETSQGAGSTDLLTRVNGGGVDFQPLDSNASLPGWRLRAMVGAADTAGGGPVAVFQLDAIIELAAGVPTLVDFNTVIVLDTSAGDFDATFVTAPGNDGFGIQVTQNVNATPNVSWTAECTIQSLTPTP